MLRAWPGWLFVIVGLVAALSGAGAVGLWLQWLGLSAGVSALAFAVLSGVFVVLLDRLR